MNNIFCKPFEWIDCCYRETSSWRVSWGREATKPVSWDTNSSHRKEGRISYLLLLSIFPSSFISLLPALSSHLYISHHYIIGRVVSPSWMLNLVLVVFNHHHPLMILRTGHFYDMQRLWLLVIIISNGSIVIVRIEKRGNTF